MMLTIFKKLTAVADSFKLWMFDMLNDYNCEGLSNRSLLLTVKQ